jgi:Fe-S cluster assembly protein SufD
MSMLAIEHEERRAESGDDASLILTAGPVHAANRGFGKWFEQVQIDGWQKFSRLAMPSRSDEHWRFSNLKAINLSGYAVPKPVATDVATALVKRSVGLEQAAARLVFANDHILHRDPIDAKLSERGVIWTTIDQAAQSHPELFQSYFMREEITLGSAKFEALHKAHVRTGTFLYVPPGVEIELPFEVFHWLDGANSSVFPHTLMIAEAGSRVTLVDHFGSTDSHAPGFACGVNDLYVGEGARLTYICIQDWTRKAIAFQMNSTVVGRGGSATSLNLNLGSAYARTESMSRLAGEEARSDMLAVSVPTGSQEFDQRTMQDHRKPQTYSDLLYKNALSDTARTIFAGLIRVEPHAHFTDAYQKVRNLLLSEEAEANSMPGLEILADNVKCSHGATTGQIDEEELFYLMSRGIDKTAAEHLIIEGFLNEVFTRIDNDPIAEVLRAAVQRKFAERETLVS